MKNDRSLPEEVTKKAQLQLTDRQQVLFDWVKIQHGTQVRKYTGEPYWTHLLSVATIVSQLESKNSRNEIEIALCHDLLEDTKVDRYLLESTLFGFGYRQMEVTRIITGVVDLTDEYTHEKYPDSNREARKAMEANRLALIQPYSQTVKYADIIDNLESIVEHDPKFAVIFLREIGGYIKRIFRGNMSLYGDVLRAFSVSWEKIYNLHGEE